jgi:hypothetical protein
MKHKWEVRFVSVQRDSDIVDGLERAESEGWEVFQMFINEHGHFRSHYLILRKPL